MLQDYLTPVALLRLLPILFTAHIASSIAVIVYNVWFHPLAKFPGPKLAGATIWYRIYIEVFKQQSLVRKLAELHAVYGEIVRIEPNELHFSNPASYNQIYAPQIRWDKAQGKIYQAFEEDNSSFGYPTYHEAKARRDILAPLFSKRSLVNMQGIIRGKIELLCDKLAARSIPSSSSPNGKSSNMFMAYRCFTLDTICAFCFGNAIQTKALEAPDFEAPMLEAMEATMGAVPILTHFPNIRRALNALPASLMLKLAPATSGLASLRDLLMKQIKELSKDTSVLDKAEHPIIYHRLLDPSLLKEGQGLPDLRSLYEEAQNLLLAGADTVGNTLMLGTFHLLYHQDQLDRLRQEIRDAWPDLKGPAPIYEELEKLPYLTAVIKESLRISYGIVTPLPRVIPAEGATIADSFIPGGAHVAMSPVFIHESPEIFPQPEKFLPERWIDQTGLEAWICNFSKGPRMCLGTNLAWCELYIAFAHIFRKFDLKLDDSKLEDLTWRECFLPKYTGKHLTIFARPAKD